MQAMLLQVHISDCTLFAEFRLSYLYSSGSRVLIPPPRTVEADIVRSSMIFTGT